MAQAKRGLGKGLGRGLGALFGEDVVEEVVMDKRGSHSHENSDSEEERVSRGRKHTSTSNVKSNEKNQDSTSEKVVQKKVAEEKMSQTQSLSGEVEKLEPKTQPDVSRETLSDGSVDRASVLDFSLEQQAIEKQISASEKGEETHGEIYVKLSKIEPNRSQPRKNFDEEQLQQLADSMKRYGVLQPLLVQKRENGFEIIEARMTDVIRKTYFYQDAQIKEYHLNKPIDQKVWYRTADTIFDFAHKLTDSIAKEHPLYEPACRMDELVKDSDPIIHHTFDAGEGVLIPGEILHHAKHGCKFFLILQPFGCLPNHVVGRGITKKLKEIYPDVQILPLDYDPDVSFANIENRLQMLVMNAKQAKRRVSVVQKKENKKETVKKGKIHKQESYC